MKRISVVFSLLLLSFTSSTDLKASERFSFTHFIQTFNPQMTKEEIRDCKTGIIIISLCYAIYKTIPFAQSLFNTKFKNYFYDDEDSKNTCSEEDSDTNNQIATNTHQKMQNSETTPLSSNATNEDLIDPNMKNEHGYTPLHVAIQNNDTNLVKHLLAHPNIDPNIEYYHMGLHETPLQIATRNNNLDIVKLLLAHLRIIIYKHYEYHSYNLHILDRALRRGNIEMAKLILSKYIEQINLENKIDTISFCDIINLEYTEMVKFLLNEVKLDPNILNQCGQTALMNIAKIQHCNDYQQIINTMQLLLNHPIIDPNIVDKDGNTALLYAMNNSHNEMINLLLNHPKIELNKNIYTKEKNNYAFLQMCSKNGNINTIKRVFETLEIDINYQNEYYNTVLHVTCQKNTKNWTDIGQNYHQNLIDFLLSKNPNLSLKNNYGKTPLLCAAQNDIDLVNKLLKYGASLETEDESNQTALYHLYTNNHIDNINQIIYTKNNDSTSLLNKELYKICSIKEHTKKYYSDPTDYINDFICWCKQNGANLNARNKKNLRPVDYAEKLYNHALKHSIERECAFKQKLYYTFLKQTPCCSNIELYWHLKNNNMIPDTYKKILGYHKALTIERDIAINNDNNQNKMSLQYFKQQCIADECKKLGYINPFNS